MKKYRTRIKNELSKNIVDYLHDCLGDNYSQIAKKVEVDRAHICRVAQGKKGFSLNRLVKIQEAYNIPIPIILLNSIREEDIPKELKPAYKSLKELLKDSVFNT